MSFIFPRPRRPRFVHAILGCTVFLAYFLWFDSYTRSPPPLLPSAPPETVPKRPARILLVSALLPLQQAKHPLDYYRLWLTHFLGPTGVRCDVYFYTTPSLEPLLRSLNHPLKLTIDTNYTTPFSIPPLAPHRDKYTRMHAWDREQALHSPELYAVWNAKPWLLNHAIHALNGTSAGDYDYVFWTDAGSFRNAHGYSEWPDRTRVEEMFRVAKAEAGGDDPVFFPLFEVPSRKEYAWMPEEGPVDVDFSEGSFFGSTPAGIAWYTRTFYEAHDHYLSTAPPALPPPPQHPHAPRPSSSNSTPSSSPPQQPFHFIGKDQTLINTLLFRYPSRFFGVIAPLRTPLLPPGSAFSSSPRSPRGKPFPYPYALGVAHAFARFHTDLRVRAALKLHLVCGVDWYYYQWWLATPEERRETELVKGWDITRSWKEKGWWWRWWWWTKWVGLGKAEHGGCGDPETRLISVERVLVGLFGREWVEERRG